MEDLRLHGLLGGAGKSIYFGNGEDGNLDSIDNITLTSTTNGPAIVKQYENITINEGHKLTVSNPCRGLVMYVRGTLTINGTLSMDYKAIPYTPANEKQPKVGVYEKEVTFADTVNNIFGMSELSLISLGLGGAGGAGGNNQRISGIKGTGGAAISSGGFFGGAFGAGGGGGGVGYSGIAYGGQGGAASATTKGTRGNRVSSVADGHAAGLNGELAAGASGGSFDGGWSGYGGSAPAGGGGGGCYHNNTGGNGGTSLGPGGLLIIIANNIIVGPSGKISSNGDNGGLGGAAGHDSSPLYGGGGGGGNGGGIISLNTKSLTNNGTIEVNGGLGGEVTIKGTPGLPGSPGGLGLIHTNIF